MKQSKIEDYSEEKSKSTDIIESEWRNVPLGSVCVINPSKSEISDLPDNLLVSFVPMSSIDEITGAIIKRETKELGGIRRGYVYFREHDILFAKITPCMENGKCAIALNLKNEIGLGSTEFFVIRPSKYIHSEWIYFYLRQERLRLEAKSHFKGAVGQQRVPKEFLENLNIPLPFNKNKPNFNEQSRIISIIKDQLKRIDDLHFLFEELLRLIAQYRQSILKSAFDGMLA